MFNLQPITTHRFPKTEHKAESTADWLKVFATTHLLRVGHQREKVAHLTRAQLTQNFKLWPRKTDTNTHIHCFYHNNYKIKATFKYDSFSAVVNNNSEVK